MNQSPPISTIEGKNPGPNPSGGPIASPPNMTGSKQPALFLVSKLCEALAEEDITYCHWKSTNMLERSASGDNDLDLLISRADASQFTELLLRLGFKQAKAPEEKQMPGVLDYYGYDEEADKLVHVHAHYQLRLGHDMTKNFRLALERPYLESANQGELFRIPAIEFEFIIFVVRMILKHSTWDTIVGREGKLTTGERNELTYLQASIKQDRVNEILKSYLPQIDFELFRNCIQALQPGCSAWGRIKTGRNLQNRLQADAAAPLSIDIFLKFWRRAVLMIRRRLFKSSPKYRLETGGALIALVGGDGAGKSTAVKELETWVSKNFNTTSVHMGKPVQSGTTIFVRSILKIGQLLRLYPLEASFDETIQQKSLISPGYPYLIREVCRAHDRYRTYIKARRFAAKGGLVILDRFPLPKVQIMDGAQTERFIRQLQEGPQAKQFLSPRLESRLSRFLVKREKMYYSQIMLPDLLIVLTVDPQIAVQRKPDEDALSVWERSSEIWRLNWENMDVCVIDASRSKAEVASELKRLIWSRL
jgi:thymidylate kinase